MLPAIGALPLALVPATVAAAVVLAALARWPYRSISFRGAALAAAAVSLAADVAFAGPQGLVLLWMPAELGALCVLLGRAVRTLPDRRVAATSAVVVVAVLLLPLRLVLYRPAVEHRPAAFVVLSAVFLVPAALAAAIGLYLRSLDDRRRAAVLRARREERLEVAHGLHDFVAHELTGIVLEAQAAQLSPVDAAQTRSLLQRIETAGLRALDSMDDTVRMLLEPDGDDGQPPTVRLYGLRDLPELIERFRGVDAAAEVELLIPDVLPALGQEADAVGYTVVVEGLTNVRRHAPEAGRVTVVVDPRDDGTVEIVVTDGGGGGHLYSRAGSGGTGLVGLAERVEALGGRLTAGPLDDGWTVCAVVPVRHKPRPGRTGDGA